MVHTRLFRDGKLVEEGFDPAKVSDCLEDEANLVWLDLEDPSEQELSLIEEEFSLHPLAIEDARHRDQRPKLESYEGYSFLVTYGVDVTDDGLQQHEVHAFVGAHYLITIRYQPPLELAPVLATVERHDDLLRDGGGFLLYALLDHVVDGYFDVVDRLEEESEDLEEEVFAEDVPADVQERIFRLKKRVIEFRRRVGPIREVLVQLQEQASIVTTPLEAYYRDVSDHVIRALELIDMVRDLLTGALEAHLARTGNRLNEVAKAVTSWAAIILVPTLIAGIYGMNFERVVPGWGSPAGFWIALGLMVVSAVALYAAFKRQGWL